MCRTRFGWFVAAGFILVLLPLARPALAADAEPASSQPRREVHDTVGASVNNAGLQNVLDISWMWGLSSSQDALRRDAHVALGLTHYLTPSFTRMGVWAEISPLSVLNLRVGVEPAVYFGTFHSLMSFNYYSDAFDNASRSAQRNPAGFGTAGRMYVSPTVKMKVGPMAALASADFEWWRSSAPGPLFYEPARDTLLSAESGRLLNTTALLRFQHVADTGTLSAGLLHKLTDVHDAPANRIQQIGGIVTREFKGKRFGLNRPTVIGNVSYYLNDPSKQHTLSTTLAVAFNIDR